MPSRDGLVDLSLRVEPARLEVLDQPAQDREPLLALDRDARQPSGGVDKGFADPRVVRVLTHPVITNSTRRETDVTRNFFFFAPYLRTMGKVGIALVMLALTACAALHSPGPEQRIPWLPLKADLNAPPVPSPQPMPVPPGTPKCSAGQLLGGVIGSQGATGNVITSFAFSASGSTACYLDGTPLVTLLDPNGKDLGFHQRNPYMPSMVSGPALVNPGPKPEMPQGLKFGEAGFNIDWISQPEACQAQSGVTVASARIKVASGGTVLIPLPQVPAGYPCQGVGVSSFEGPAMPVEVTPPPTLPAVAVTAPTSAKAGMRFDYTVALTNDTKAPMNFVANCPNYEEELFSAGGLPLGGKHFYKLNCAPAGTLAPGQSAKFQMILSVPVDASPGGYNLVFMLGYWNAMSRFTEPRAVHITT